MAESIWLSDSVKALLQRIEPPKSFSLTLISDLLYASPRVVQSVELIFQCVKINWCRTFEPLILCWAERIMHQYSFIDSLKASQVWWLLIASVLSTQNNGKILSNRWKKVFDVMAGSCPKFVLHGITHIFLSFLKMTYTSFPLETA